MWSSGCFSEGSGYWLAAAAERRPQACQTEPAPEQPIRLQSHCIYRHNTITDPQRHRPTASPKKNHTALSAGAWMSRAQSATLPPFLPHLPPSPTPLHPPSTGSSYPTATLKPIILLKHLKLILDQCRRPCSALYRLFMSDCCHKEGFVKKSCS